MCLTPSAVTFCTRFVDFDVVLKQLLSFPNPVNDVAARLVAGGVVAMIVLTLVADLPWISAVIAYGFIARALTGPTLSPLGRLASGLAPALPFPAKPVDGPPKRFAQAIGAVFSSCAALLVALGQESAGYIVLAVLLVPASLEAFAGLCIGCKIFGVLIRAGLIPASVCAECADIWRGRERMPG